MDTTWHARTLTRMGTGNRTNAIVTSAVPANREATKPPTLKVWNGRTALPSHGQKEWGGEYFPADHDRHAIAINFGKESAKGGTRMRQAAHTRLPSPTRGAAGFHSYPRNFKTQKKHRGNTYLIHFMKLFLDGGAPPTAVPNTSTNSMIHECNTSVACSRGSRNSKKFGQGAVGT